MGRQVDVKAEVETIRQMYDQIKHDIESNQPERFASSSGGLQAMMSSAEKKAGMESKIQRLSQLLEDRLDKGKATVDAAVKNVEAQRNTAQELLENEKSRVINDTRVARSEHAKARNLMPGPENNQQTQMVPYV